jgi:hypothetical protein
MNGNEIIALGLGLQALSEIVSQTLTTEATPSELRLTIRAERGTLYPCPVCGTLWPAHDFKEMTWRHLNFWLFDVSSGFEGAVYGGCQQVDDTDERFIISVSPRSALGGLKNAVECFKPGGAMPCFPAGQDGLAMLGREHPILMRQGRPIQIGIKCYKNSILKRKIL